MRSSREQFGRVNDRFRFEVAGILSSPARLCNIIHLSAKAGLTILSRIVALFLTIAKQQPIEDQVDVLSKTVNQSDDCGKDRAAFEDHLTLERRFRKEVFENSANPEVLFYNSWIHSERACRLAE